MDLALALHGEAPLHRQIYDQLRQGILAGRLGPGQRLPASRTLAKSLGLSRTTVIQAYDQLIAEGYLHTRPGAGTYVGDQLPEALLTAAAPEVSAAAPREITLSAYGQRVAQAVSFQRAKPPRISFRYGHPALDLFPMERWRRLLSARCRRAAPASLGYAEPLGYGPLREAIAAYLQQSRAVRCSPEQIMITGGSQQALALIVQLLVNPGDGIAMEEPGYRGAYRIFAAGGARVLPIGVDSQGLRVEQLQGLDPPPRLAYVTPSHQFPTGALLSLPRRLALLQWAHRTGGLIIEDDYDSEFRYGGRPMPALQGLDGQGSVLYVGTFSKVMFPGLRLGYLVLPPSLVKVFAEARWLIDRQPPSLPQEALTDFIIGGHFERHLRRMRTCYDERRGALLEALETYLGPVEVLGDSAGLHAMVRLELGMEDEGAIALAAQAGIELCSARIQYAHPCRWGEFVFGYSSLSPKILRQGIKELALALKQDC